MRTRARPCKRAPVRTRAHWAMYSQRPRAHSTRPAPPTRRTVHAPHRQRATLPARHTASAPHRQRATPPARRTAGTPPCRHAALPHAALPERRTPPRSHAAPPARHTAGTPHRRHATRPARHSAGTPHRRHAAPPPARPTAGTPHHRRHAAPPERRTVHRYVRLRGLRFVRPPACTFFLSTRAPARRFTSHRQPFAGARPRRTEPAPPGACGFLQCDRRAASFMHTVAAPRPCPLTNSRPPALFPRSVASLCCLSTTLPSLLVCVMCPAALCLLVRICLVSPALRARCTSMLRTQSQLSYACGAARPRVFFEVMYAVKRCSTRHGYCGWFPFRCWLSERQTCCAPRELVSVSCLALSSSALHDM